MRPSRPLLRQALSLVAVLGSVGLGFTAGARAQAEAHPELRDFLLSGQYILTVDGKEVPSARIYHSQPAGAYLVRAADLYDFGILILPRTGCVETVKAEEMKEREDGGLDLLVTVTPCGLGKFRLEDADVVFQVKETPARLKPKPPLTGTHWASRLVEHSPEYARAAKAYAPDPERLKVLAGVKTEARIQIFFGTWCSFCNRFLPNTLKVEEELKKEGTSLSFEYHGLPAPPAAWVTPEATQMQVRKLPTGLVFVGDKLVGRLEGNDWIRPEVSLSRVIR